MSHACSVFADIRGHDQILWHLSMDGCKSPCESWEMNLDSLQQTLITAEPSLISFLLFFLNLESLKISLKTRVKSSK